MDRYKIITLAFVVLLLSGAVGAVVVNIDGSGLLTQINTKVNKTDASELSGGTLADGRLSSNVPLKNTANTFTARQFFNGGSQGIAGVVVANWQPLTWNNNAGTGTIDVIQLAASTNDIYIGLNNTNIYYRTVGSGSSIKGQIDSAGHVFYNSLTSSAQTNAMCYNSGTGELTYNNGVTTCLASNESLKNNITNITGTITPFAMNLTAKRFKLNYEDNSSGNSQWHIGFMGQDIQTLTKGTIFNNSLVDHDITGSITGVQYEEFTALLLKVIQEQQTTINKICSRNQTLCS